MITSCDGTLNDSLIAMLSIFSFDTPVEVIEVVRISAYDARLVVQRDVELPHAIQDVGEGVRGRRTRKVFSDRKRQGSPGKGVPGLVPIVEAAHQWSKLHLVVVPGADLTTSHFVENLILHHRRQKTPAMTSARSCQGNATALFQSPFEGEARYARRVRRVHELVKVLGDLRETAVVQEVLLNLPLVHDGSGDETTLPVTVQVTDREAAEQIAELSEVVGVEERAEGFVVQGAVAFQLVRKAVDVSRPVFARTFCLGELPNQGATAPSGSRKSTCSGSDRATPTNIISEGLKLAEHVRVKTREEVRGIVARSFSWFFGGENILGIIVVVKPRRSQLFLENQGAYNIRVLVPRHATGCRGAGGGPTPEQL